MLAPIELLKLRLMTEGISVSPAARALLAGTSGCRPLTLADYASTSGISLRLGESTWVNAPIAEHNPNFVTLPTDVLDASGDGFVVRSSELEVPAFPVGVPDYHDKVNEEGEPYTSYVYSHTDRARISPIEGCAVVCKFCDLPYEYRYRSKRVDGLVDAARVALHDAAAPARHLLISGGTPRVEDYGYLTEVYERTIQAFVGTPIDVMMMPSPGLLDLDRLANMGVNFLSINLEIFNRERARKLMPVKGRLGREYYLDFIERAVARFGPGRVRSLILVGIEDMADTIAGVEALAQRGCEPVLSPFRPDPSTPMNGHPPPSVDFLAETYQRSRDIAARHGVRLGPRCIPCMHNTLTFPDGSDYYFHS